MLGGATFSGLGRGQVFAISTTGAASLISALVLPSLTRFHNSAGPTVGFCTSSGCVFAGASLTASVSEVLTIPGGATFFGLGRGQVFAISTTGAASLISALVLPSLTRFHNSAGSTVGLGICSGCVFAGASLTASVSEILDRKSTRLNSS